MNHRRRVPSFFWAISACFGVTSMLVADVVPPPAAQPTKQIALPRIELMSDAPRGFKLLDFNAVARGYDHVVFTPVGGTPPLMWWDDTKTNMPATGIGLPSYVAHPEMKGGNNHEAITVLGALLGGTLSGVDESKRDPDLAAMSAEYFNSANGMNLVLNRVSTKTSSYWYDLFPQIVFDTIANRYPNEKRLGEISDIAAHRWLGAFDALAKNGPPSFEHISFDFDKMKPLENKDHREPDAAAGMAEIFYTAYLRGGDKHFLDAADVCLKTMENRDASPSYEILMPFGAYTAARINAEQNEGQHDVGKLLNDFFEPTSNVRAGWGLIVGNWNGVEASGLIGSVNDAGGYGFVMNTYAAALGVVPIARYDERYARSIGKWMLNASGAVRYCYPGQLPLDNTTKPDFKSDPPNVIAFEGIRHRYKGKSPLAGGDPTVYGWGPCDLGLYGSGFAGVYGGIIRPTSDPLILQLDLLAADPCPPKSFPTYLYFNPHTAATTIRVDVGATPVDLYDSLENRVIVKAKHGVVEMSIPAGAARMIVRVPAGSTITADGRRSKVGDVVIDYENGVLPPRPPPSRAATPSKARRVDVPKFTPMIDGNADDWRGHSSVPLALDTGGRGTMKAETSFAWDDQFLYVLVRETHAGKDSHEAKDLAAFSTTPWDFDAADFYIDLGNGRQASLGDFVLQLAFESASKHDVGFSSQAPDDGTAKIASATSGTFAGGDRVIEARVAWSGIASAAFGEGSKPQITPGMTVGCEPCLVEMNHTRQSFIGGSQYQRPTGIDSESTDLVLQGPR